MRVDAVFEGGGIKGLAFIGAVEVLEDAGYKWERLAGTSAGSIIATLLATGMNAREIKTALLKFPFEQLEWEKGLNRIPYLGPYISVSLYNGIYRLDSLQDWLQSQLRKIGKVTFGDLPDGKLKIIVTDITRNKMCILPDDLPSYGVDPALFPLAAAVRMSCSVPFVFRPTKLNGSIMMDGGVLSNYPVWIFDTKERPRWPTFGFRLSGIKAIEQPKKIKGPIRLLAAIIRTMLESQDNFSIDEHSTARTITIKGINHSCTQFNIALEEKEKLVQLGRESAVNFLIHWNFEQYISVFRPPCNETETKV